jgi:hypothetical protein
MGSTSHYYKKWYDKELEGKQSDKFWQDNHSGYTEEGF